MICSLFPSVVWGVAVADAFRHSRFPPPYPARDKSHHSQVRSSLSVDFQVRGRGQRARVLSVPRVDGRRCALHHPLGYRYAAQRGGPVIPRLTQRGRPVRKEVGDVLSVVSRYPQQSTFSRWCLTVCVEFLMNEFFAVRLRSLCKRSLGETIFSGCVSSRSALGVDFLKERQVLVWKEGFSDVRAGKKRSRRRRAGKKQRKTIFVCGEQRRECLDVRWRTSPVFGLQNNFRVFAAEPFFGFSCST